MKRLLQSKRFRKNLYKWLTMYASVILMFATVVTYSKYITNLMGDENSSRTTKFDVSVKAICNSEVDSEEKITNEEGQEENVDVCKTKHTDPKENINYYFMVDTRELEVTTLLVLNVKVHPDFEIQSFDEVEKDGDTFKVKNYASDDKNKPKTELCKNSGKDNGEENQKCELSTLTQTIIATKGKVSYYKVSIKYNYGDATDDKDSLSKEYPEIVKIGYAATQIDKDEVGV